MEVKVTEGRLHQQGEWKWPHCKELSCHISITGIGKPTNISQSTKSPLPKLACNITTNQPPRRTPHSHDPLLAESHEVQINQTWKGQESVRKQSVLTWWQRQLDPVDVAVDGVEHEQVAGGGDLDGVWLDPQLAAVEHRVHVVPALVPHHGPPRRRRPRRCRHHRMPETANRVKKTEQASEE